MRWHAGLAAAALVLGATLNPAARGAAYEPFAAAPGTRLDGQSGGSGFATPWVVAPIVPASLGATTEAGSLAAPGGTNNTAGGHLQVTPPPAGELDGFFASRTLAEQVGTTGTEFWLSFLMRRAGPTAGEGWSGIRFGMPPLQSGPEYFIGEPGGGPANGRYVIGMAGADASAVDSGVPLVLGQTALLVVRFQYTAGNDIATLYVNPTPGQAPSGGVTFNGIDSAVGQPGVQIEAAMNPGASLPSHAFDELRFGRTFDEVVPVPEPAAGTTLLLVTLLACLPRERRRRGRGAFALEFRR